MNPHASHHRRARHRRFATALSTAGMVISAPALAQFAAAVTPPRFELSVEPGQLTRQVMEITQASPGANTYRVYTNDWAMSESGALTFFDDLQPGSCRPWVAIERKEVTVAMGSRVRYRFEVAPPAGVAAQECRFALMLEGKPQDVKTGEGSSFPMSGRIAVIVYVSVGGARAVLEPGATSIGQLEGQAAPVLTVRNSGNATGRLAGILTGNDASGSAFEFTPETVPILPGRTRQITLQPYEPGPRTTPSASAPAAAPRLKWPLSLRGTLEYGSKGNERFDLERTVTERPAQ
jgi:hypothetical protein